MWPFPVGIWIPSNTWFLALKQYLDRFSCCWLVTQLTHVPNTQTHRPRYVRHCSSSRISCRWCGSIIIIIQLFSNCFGFIATVRLEWVLTDQWPRGIRFRHTSAAISHHHHHRSHHTACPFDTRRSAAVPSCLITRRCDKWHTRICTIFIFVRLACRHTFFLFISCRPNRCAILISSLCRATLKFFI